VTLLASAAASALFVALWFVLGLTRRIGKVVLVAGARAGVVKMGEDRRVAR